MAGKFGIGQAVRRVEDQRFLTGHGHYIDDIDLPGQAFGALVLSPHAHARIKRIDVAKAKAAPGVLAVLTGADMEAAAVVNVGRHPPLSGRGDQVEGGERGRHRAIPL